MIGEDKLLRFSGVPLGEACTLVLRGATQQILDEAERSIHDALCVLASTVKETRTVYGGGNPFLCYSCLETLTDCCHILVFKVAVKCSWLRLFMPWLRRLQAKNRWPWRLSPAPFFSCLLLSQIMRVMTLLN